MPIGTPQYTKIAVVTLRRIISIGLSKQIKVGVALNESVQNCREQSTILHPIQLVTLT